MINEYPSLNESKKISKKRAKKIRKEHKEIKPKISIDIPEGDILITSSDDQNILVEKDKITKYIGEQFRMYINEGNNEIKIPIYGKYLGVVKKFFDTGEWGADCVIETSDEIKLIPSHNHLRLYFDKQTYTLMEYLGLDIEMIVTKNNLRVFYEEKYNKLTKRMSIEKIVEKMNRITSAKLNELSLKINKLNKNLLLMSSSMFECEFKKYSVALNDLTDNITKLDKYHEWFDIIDAYKKIGKLTIMTINMVNILGEYK